MSEETGSQIRNSQVASPSDSATVTTPGQVGGDDDEGIARMLFGWTRCQISQPALRTSRSSRNQSGLECSLSQEATTAGRRS